MTTIAFRDGVMVSDSKMSGNDVFVGEFKKVFKIVVEEELSWVERTVFRREPEQIQYLIGAAGNVEDIQDYIACLFFGEPWTKNGYDCTIMSAEKDDKGGYIIKKYEGGSMKGFEVKAKYAAIGSGFEIALGALHHGATAEEAVMASIYHDNMSGGEVQKVSFDSDA